MKKIILSLFVISLFLGTSAFSANAPAPYDFKKCASAATSDPKHCKSRAKRAKIAKAKCAAMADETNKADCLKELEDKSSAASVEKKE